MKNIIKHYFIELLLLIGTFFWGATFVIVKNIIIDNDIYTFLFIRFLIATLFLIPFFIKSLKNINKRDILYGIIVGTLLSGGYLTQTIGLKYSSVSNAAFITGLSIVMVPIFSSIKLKKIPNKKNIFAITICTIGILLLTLKEFSLNNISVNTGDIWLFICAIFFALQIIMISKYTNKINAGNIAIIELFTVSIISLLFSIIYSSFKLPKDLNSYIGIVFCAIFATSFIFIIQSKFQRLISDERAAIIYSFEPFFASLTAFVFIQEIITYKTIIGGLLVFISMLISNKHYY